MLCLRVSLVSFSVPTEEVDQAKPGASVFFSASEARDEVRWTSALPFHEPTLHNTTTSVPTFWTARRHHS
jgi:hypothetical protein